MKDDRSTKIEGLAGKLRSFVAGKALAQNGTEELREKIGEKNERLKRLREQVGKKDREIEALRAELNEARSERRLPGLFDTNAPVFFVVGRGKSGTTWLENTLNSHPEILCRGEGRFFERNFRRMVELEHLQGERLKTIQPSSLYAAISSSEDLRTWIERSVWTDGEGVEEHLENLNRLATNYFLTERLSRTDKKIVGDKTTFSDGEVINEIATTYPEARVVHMVRDGRDHAVSMMHHMWNYAKDAGGFYDLEPEEIEKREAYRKDPGSVLTQGLFTERRLTIIARAWGNQVGKAVEYGPALLGTRYAEARYEDLLERPREELGRLLEFLGAAASEEVVERCIEANTFDRWSSGRSRGEEESASFYRKGVVGDWRNVFTEEDKAIFKEAAGDTLVKLGYEKNKDW
jgi:hypothetical protein